MYDRVKELGMVVRYVLNTHDHHDHSNGNDEMERLSGCPALGFGSKDPDTGMELVDNAELPLGGKTIHIIHTPGHTEDSLCFLVGNYLFTGDTLFVGKVGGTDFGKQAETQFKSLRTKLMTLPGEVRVFPGHDVGVQPHSTIQHEKNTNPFLIRSKYEDFLDLKKNWLEYKQMHGIQ